MQTTKGKLCIKIKSQAPLTPAQQKVLKRAVRDGKLKNIQHGCRVAEDVNAAISEGIAIGGDTFTPNPHSRARFGKNARGKAYLTFGVIGRTGEKYTVTWEGAAIPMRMKAAAVAHDEGQAIPSSPPVLLPFSAAKIRPSGDGKLKPKPAGRKDINKDGELYPRGKRPVRGGVRIHERLCARDLVLENAGG